MASNDTLPSPTGWKVLIAAAKVEDKKGSVLLPEHYTSLEDTASIIGCVMKLGADCYKDEEKFPGGPYCKEGDWVMFRSYSGTRFKLGKQEFRFLNDDQVEAIVPDPRLIERV
jgi:co-chaperonin GroES (HSP10)